MENSLGKKLREVRKAKGLTLKEVAEQIGKTESYLSQLENGKTNPSLASLKKLADCLGKPLVTLFEGEKSVSLNIVREDKRTKMAISDYLEYQLLSSPNSQIALFKVFLKKGGSSGADFYSHKGVETGVVIQGEIRITVGEKTVLLRKGDSITYHSNFPHRWENVGAETAIGIWAVSPPTF